MEREVVVDGAARTIEYAVAANGAKAAKDFIEGLDLKDQAKLLALLNRMAEHGSVPNREQFKPVRGKVFEFKKHQIRVFCFRDGNRWLLTNGCVKKKDRLSPAEIDRAERIMDEHQRRERLGVKGSQ